MENPYKLDPESLKAKQRTMQEDRLITLKDDSSRPPPTIGVESFQGIMFGPAAGQPSSDYSDSKPSWGKKILGYLIWFWVAALVVRIAIRLLR